jgi:isocitrate/isopropylmalate dehydrogenase
MRVAVIAGDGIGKDVTAEAVKVLGRVSDVFGCEIALEPITI